MRQLNQNRQIAASVTDTPAPGPAVEMIPAGVLVLDTGLLLRPEGLNQEVVAGYAAIMRDAAGWGPFPPVKVCRDTATGALLLVGGFHRRAAFVQVAGDLAEVPAVVMTGTRRDAVLAALEENRDHGLPVSDAGKRAKVRVMLADAEWRDWSNREIARRCGVSAPFVAKVREDLTINSFTVTTGATAAPAAAEPTPADAGGMRTYTTRHGTQATMRTGNIGKSHKRYVSPEPPAVDAGPAIMGTSHDAPAPSVVASDATHSRQHGAELARCAVCGRPLSDPAHAAAGCGPVCAAKRAGNFVAAAGDAGDDAGAGSGVRAVAGVVYLDLLTGWAHRQHGRTEGALLRVRDRLLAAVDALAEYASLTGDDAGADAARDALALPLARLAATVEGVRENGGSVEENPV